jgi:U3 small nucleolar RNA-associated protein 3
VLNILLFTETLLTYATTLAYYLHLVSKDNYARRPTLLKSHPILARLLTLKESLSTLEDLDFVMSDSEDVDELSSYDDDDGDAMMDMELPWQLKGLEAHELEELLQDAQSLSSDETPPKKKRKTTVTKKLKPVKPSLPIFDLVEPTFQSSRQTVSAQSDLLVADAYGEATSLQHVDAVDKSTRKKSLRFHTSRIESTRSRRQGTRNNAVGGDDDLPYRERIKGKEARLARETKVRGQGGEDLDNVEPELVVATRMENHTADSDGEGTDAYYELVKRKSKVRKETKQAEYEASQAASR